LLRIKGDQNRPQTTPSALAWGWPVLGCVQKFNPSFISSLNLILKIHVYCLFKYLTYLTTYVSCGYGIDRKITTVQYFCFSEIAAQGFPLPVVDGIQLINAEVMPGQVRIDFYLKAVRHTNNRSKSVYVNRIKASCLIYRLHN